MNLHIKENKCMDKEVQVLDTKLPYLYHMIKEAFLEGPENVEVEIIKCKEEFSRLTGNTRGVVSTVKNKIFILEPSKFEENNHSRDEFYKLIYKELINMFYNKP